MNKIVKVIWVTVGVGVATGTAALVSYNHTSKQIKGFKIEARGNE